MSHDYEPSWDYPVIDLDDVLDVTPAEKAAIQNVIERVRLGLVPALTFNEENEIEVFFVEVMGLSHHLSDEAVAVYCSGTASRPVVGFDLQFMKQVCEDEGLDLAHQFEVSLAHELGHAYQESLGLGDEHEHGFDEDDAEAFGRKWADLGVIDLELLYPAGMEDSEDTRRYGPG